MITTKQQKSAVFVTFLSFFILFGILTTPAIAQSDFFPKAKPMPEYELIPQEEFEKITTEHNFVPKDNKSLSYRIRFPAKWEGTITSNVKKELDFGGDLLGEIYRYYSEPRQTFRSFISVQVADLDYQTSALTWFTQFALINGHNVQSIGEIDYSQAEAIYVTITRDGVTYVVRSIATISGNQIVLVQYFIPIEFWNDERDLQASVMNSFELLDKQPPIIEEMINYDFLDISSLRYPESWVVKAPPFRTVDKMDMQLFNFRNQESEVVEGRMDVSLISIFGDESIRDNINNHIDRLKESGIVLGQVLRINETLEFHEDMEHTYYTAYKAQDREDGLKKYEVWLAVAYQQDYFYISSLITPARDEDYFVWARNIEAFRLVVKGLLPQKQT